MRGGGVSAGFTWCRPSFRAQQLRRVALGQRHRLASTSVWACGGNETGACGVRAIYHPVLLQPQPLVAQHGLEEATVTIAAGAWHSVAITRVGRLCTWGLNTDGQLGRGNGVWYDTIGYAEKCPEPLRLADAGRAHTVVATATAVYAFGSSCYGQTGSLSGPDFRQLFFPCRQDETVQQVACGLDHTLVVTAGPGLWPRLWACGWGGDGQTGQGHDRSIDELSLVELAASAPLVKVSTTADCCLALFTDGSIHGWGNSEYSQTGFGTVPEQLLKPTRQIAAPAGVVDIAAGGSFAALLTNDGQLYVSGLFQGRETSAFELLAHELVGADRPVKLAAGGHFLAMVCWCLVLSPQR